MRALRYDGSGVILDARCDDPTPARRDVLIRPARLGVSFTDLQVSRGVIPFRGVMGQEFVGVVEAIGDEIQSDRADLLRGRRVVASIAIRCGACDMCRAGLGAHCRDQQVLGCHRRDGCFADLVVVPEQNVYVVPDEIDDDAAVFAEALAGAIHAAQLVHVERKPYVTVLGDGVAGLLCAQVLARLNASVRVAGRHPRKFGLCEKWGIKHRAIDEIGRRRDQDVVLDCTGSLDGIGTALGLVRPRGTIVVKSSPGPVPAGTVLGDEWKAPVDLGALVSGEVELIGAGRGSVSDALVMLRRGEVDVLSLITKRARLDDGPEAVAAAGETDQIKVVMGL